MAKEAKFNHVAKERMIEARLAEACSRKRNFIVDEVKQGLQGGGKVVVFTARRSETEVWAQKIRKAVSQGDEQTGASVWMAHGGISETERDEITDAFRNHEGPCCLVATGQSVGTGVDGMQTADLAIFAMLPWKPGDFVQWKGRFDRLGGRATLLKVVVAVGTYDERVVEILTDKFGPIMDFLAADEIKGLDTKLLGLENQEALVESICDRLFGAPA
jgi:superfamily II DNA helicase RecQ